MTVPSLSDINGLSPAAAREFFLSCCGSSRWAEGMASCRPFWDARIVFNAADVLWEYLADEDRREALRNRTGVDGAGHDAALRDDLEYYRNKFGYDFVMAVPPGSVDELREVVRRRLEYPAKAEFELASAEEFAIMRAELRRRVTP